MAESVELREPVRMDDAEIKKVARGLVESHVFTHAMCPPDMIGNVFMPILLGGLNGIDLDKVGGVYEWMDKANELSVNGYPTFMSCHLVHADDWVRLYELALKIEAALTEAMQ